MVAHLLRLRLRLLANSFQRSTWQVIALIVGLVYGVGSATVVSLGLLGLRIARPEVAAPVVTVVGSLLVLGFLVVPLLFGVDDAMDPRKFALFGINNKQLANGLAIAALVGVPAVAITMIAVSQIFTWSRGPMPAILAIVGAALIVVTCVLGSRVTTSLAAFALSTRRARDATATGGLVLLVILSPLFLLLINIDWRRDGIAVLESISRIVGWTPLGAVWSAPAAAAAGEPREAVAKVMIAAAFVLVLWALWRSLVATMLVTPQRIAPTRLYRGLGWFRVFAATPTGAIAARTFTYWGRDARYFVSLIVIPIVPLLMIVPLVIVGVPLHYLALLPVPVVALFLGWSIHNDVAYDSSAIWLHVVSDTPGGADRFGRAVPALLLGIPVLVAGSFVSAELYGDGSILPSLLGVSLGILFSGLGLSSIMSARFPYPVARPGDSPFSGPQSTGTASSIIQSLSFILTFLLAIPALIFAGLGMLVDPSWAWASFAVGISLGLVVLALGIYWGGHIFSKRAPELLAFSMRN